MNLIFELDHWVLTWSLFNNERDAKLSSFDINWISARASQFLLPHRFVISPIVHPSSVYSTNLLEFICILSYTLNHLDNLFIIKIQGQQFPTTKYITFTFAIQAFLPQLNVINNKNKSIGLPKMVTNESNNEYAITPPPPPPWTQGMEDWWSMSHGFHKGTDHWH